MSRTWRPVAALVGAAGLVLALSAGAAAAPSPGPVVTAAAAGLRSAPLYVSPDAGTLPVDARALLARLSATPGTVMAVLPASAASETGGEAAALPGAIAAALGRPATVVVVAGRTISASSATIGPTALDGVVGRANTVLAVPGLSRSGATSALVNLVIGIGAAGQAGSVAATADPSSSPSSAGSPGGISGLVAGGVLLAGLAIWVPLMLRRAGRPRPVRARRTPDYRVEVDARGQITRYERVSSPDGDPDPKRDPSRGTDSKG